MWKCARGQAEEEKGGAIRFHTTNVLLENIKVSDGNLQVIRFQLFGRFIHPSKQSNKLQRLTRDDETWVSQVRNPSDSCN